MINRFSGKFSKRNVEVIILYLTMSSIWCNYCVFYNRYHARFEHCLEKDRNGANEVMGKHACINVVRPKLLSNFNVSV